MKRYVVEDSPHLWIPEYLFLFLSCMTECAWLLSRANTTDAKVSLVLPNGWSLTWSGALATYLRDPGANVDMS